MYVTFFFSYQNKDAEHKVMIAHIEEALAEKTGETGHTSGRNESRANSKWRKRLGQICPRQFQAEQRHHVEEMEGISREWEIERKVCCDQCALCVRKY